MRSRVTHASGEEAKAYSNLVTFCVHVTYLVHHCSRPFQHARTVRVPARTVPPTPVLNAGIVWTGTPCIPTARAR